MQYKLFYKKQYLTTIKTIDKVDKYAIMIG